MAAKTSQLQIRISPERKAVLKRLAAAEGVSLSEYVLSKALPSQRAELQERIEALAEADQLDERLAVLCAYLGELSDDAFGEATTATSLGHLAPVLQNYAAAAVEREAHRRRLTPPWWTTRTDPPEKPHFIWDLRSLRPHLMRVTPPTFKRRRLFVAGLDEPVVSTSPTSPEALLARFDEALSEEDLSLELCVVGGAVMRLSFRAHPATRRPRALFIDRQAGLDSIRRAAERGGIPFDRLEDAAREHTGPAEEGLGVYEGRSLRVLAAPPDYVLAMKCAALSFAPEPGSEDDIRYLLRFLGVRTANAAMTLVRRYLTSRQRPADLEKRLGRLLG